MTSEEALWALESAWRELFLNASYPTPFCSWEWVSRWWRHFSLDAQGRGRCRLLLLLALDTEGQLIGLAPFYYTPDVGTPLRLRDLRLLGDLGRYREGLTEEPTLLLRQGREQEAFDVILRHLLKTCFDRRWDYVNLRVTEWEPEPPLEALADASTRTLRLRRRQELPLQVLALPDAWDSLWRTLSKSMRDNLAYYPRLLTRRGHTWSVREVEQSDEVRQAADLLVDLHHLRAACSRGVRHTNHLSEQVHRAFLTDALPVLAAQGMASIFLLEVNGKTVAAQSVLINDGQLIIYYSGFDPEWYDYSPITILNAEAIRCAIQRGLKAVNFLLDAADYKTRWGARSERAVLELVLLQPNPLSLMRALLHRNGSLKSD